MFTKRSSRTCKLCEFTSKFFSRGGDTLEFPVLVADDQRFEVATGLLNPPLLVNTRTTGMGILAQNIPDAGLSLDVEGSRIVADSNSSGTYLINMTLSGTIDGALGVGVMGDFGLQLNLLDPTLPPPLDTTYLEVGNVSKHVWDGAQANVIYEASASVVLHLSPGASLGFGISNTGLPAFTFRGIDCTAELIKIG